MAGSEEDTGVETPRNDVAQATEKETKTGRILDGQWRGGGRRWTDRGGDGRQTGAS